MRSRGYPGHDGDLTRDVIPPHEIRLSVDEGHDVARNFYANPDWSRASLKILKRRLALPPRRLESSLISASLRDTAEQFVINCYLKRGWDSR